MLLDRALVGFPQMNSPLDTHAGDLLSALAAVARLPLSEARLGRVTRLLLGLDEPSDEPVDFAALGQVSGSRSLATERAESPEPPATREAARLPSQSASNEVSRAPAALPIAAAPAVAPELATRPPEGLALLKVQTPQGPTNISVPHALLQEVSERLGGLPAAKAMARQLAAQAPAAGRSGWVQAELRAQVLGRSESAA